VPPILQLTESFVGLVLNRQYCSFPEEKEYARICDLYDTFKEYILLKPNAHTLSCHSKRYCTDMAIDSSVPRSPDVNIRFET
jgi:hypothetical protein